MTAYKYALIYDRMTAWPLRLKKTFRQWIPMYWHRTHKTSLRVKKTIRELMPCTVGAWWCVWGDHVWGWGWLNVAIFRDHYWPAQSATRLYWQQEGPMFSYSLYVVCCLYVTFLLPPERATKAGPCHFLTKVYIQKKTFDIAWHLYIYLCLGVYIYIFVCICKFMYMYIYILD